MTFEYTKRIEYLNCIEVDTEDEESFYEVAAEIEEEIDDECDDGAEMALRKFREVFGKEKVKLIEDGSPIVEYEVN